jgi:hypothetical protein
MTEIWYMKSDYFRNGIMGFDFCKLHGFLPNPLNLGATHIFLAKVDASDPNEIYSDMQAENWSANGEAKDVIASKGLSHTSMSVGDVLVIDGNVLMVDHSGFAPLHEGILDGVTAEQIIEALLEDQVRLCGKEAPNGGLCTRDAGHLGSCWKDD